MKKEDPNRYSKLRKVVAWILFISLLGSVGYTLVQYINAPDAAVAAEGERLKSDYLLMLVQCCAGILVMFLPALLDRRLKLTTPNYMFVLFYIFLYGAIYLGEVRSFYYRIPYWDSILHMFSACMLGALGFFVVDLLNKNPEASIKLSPFFVALFSFCFALSIGAIWEIYEYSLDSILQMNMQKYRLETGEMLIGQAALSDTMKDIIIDAIGALAASVTGTITLSRKKSGINQAENITTDNRSDTKCLN